MSRTLGTCPEGFGSLRKKKKKKKDIYYQRLFVPGFSVLKRQSKFSLQLKGLQNRKSEVGGLGLKQKAPSITQEARGGRREPLQQLGVGERRVGEDEKGLHSRVCLATPPPRLQGPQSVCLESPSSLPLFVPHPSLKTS